MKQTKFNFYTQLGSSRYDLQMNANISVLGWLFHPFANISNDPPADGLTYFVPLGVNFSERNSGRLVKDKQTYTPVTGVKVFCSDGTLKVSRGGLIHYGRSENIGDIRCKPKVNKSANIGLKNSPGTERSLNMAVSTGELLLKVSPKTNKSHIIGY